MNSPYIDLPTLDQVIEYFPRTVTPDTLLIDVIDVMNQVIGVNSSLLKTRLPHPHESSCILIVEGTRLAGIFTLKDLVKVTASGRDLSRVRIAEVMTQPVISLTPTEEQNALTALLFMRHHRIRHLPIVDAQGELVGLITQDRICDVIEPAHWLKFRTVAEVMVTKVIYALPSASLLELAQIMSDRGISCVVIVAEQTQRNKNNILLPVGIVTEQDMVNFQLQGLDIAQTPAQAVISQPVCSVSPTAPLWTVQQLMQEQRVRQVVVTGDQGELQGLVTPTNLLHIFNPSDILGVMQALQKQVQGQTAELRIANQKLQQEVIKRQQVEASLQQAQADLELRVAQRTAELVCANTRLQKEMEERRRLQTALNLNQFCLDRAIDAIAYIDPNGQYIYVNDQICRVLQYSRAELLSMSVCDVHLDMCTPALWADFWTRLKQQGSVVFESLVRSRDGEVITLEINANYLNLSGQELAWGFARDVRERKQAETTLQKMATDLEILYGHIPCGYHSLDAEGRVIDINDTELAMLGYSRDEVIGRKVTDFVSPEYILFFEENFPKFKQTGLIQDCEYHLVRKDGSILPVSLSSTAIKDEAGNYLMSRTIVVDISERQAALRERQQAEANLQKSEQRLQLAIWAGNIGIWDWDLKTNQVIWSDDLFSLFGLTPDSFEVNYENFLNRIVHPEDRELLHESVLRSIDQQVHHDLEFRFIYPDGRVGWSVCKAKVLYDHTTGQPLQMIGVNMDITERKQTEVALRESEQRLQAIIDNCPSIIYLKDLQGRHILVNSEFERIFKLTQEEVDHKKNFEIFTAEVAQALSNNDQQVLQSQKPMEFEEEIPLEDGLHTYLTVKFPLCDSLRQPYAICGISTDITERQQAEQKIREQAALIDIATDAILVRDLENRILFWSQGAENLYGWKVAESVGRIAHELFQRESSSQLQAGFNTTISTGYWSGELEQITKTGQEIIVTSRWTLVRDEAGQPQSILIVNTDITEKKQLEQQFYRAQRLESIGTLASGIAHDLNNVFAPIVMIAQLLSSRYKNADARTQELFKTLETSSKRGSDLVKQILTFARGTEDQRILLQPGHLLQELVKVIKQTFPKTIEIQTTIPSNTLWMVKADPTQLDQVFMNLAVNARDAMPNGGQLTITAENYTIDETYARMHLEARAGGYILVKIADTGTGIPPESLERIFDPFFTTKEVGKGTGLGLSTVLGIVKNHGGFVEVLSQVGKGTEFQVFLPITAGIATEIKMEAELPRGNGELILVVDDEAVIQQTTKETLEAEGVTERRKRRK
ncbi:MAG TPA: PAS domain S-box protein [Trichormus sp. M33_DOE_039]|nr:PAS domain S-box protein [Trichormus sp. M33_DOE_039]